MTLAQLGAEVVRIDGLNGGLDARRWPLAENGDSLFWAGLNKGKRSVAVDLTSPAGRELVTELIAAAGNVLTNFPARGWMSYDALRKQREDLVMVALTGNPDGSSRGRLHRQPRHRLPLGDRARATSPNRSTACCRPGTASWADSRAVGLLAADRQRARNGAGELVQLALSDVAFAMVGNLGRIAQAQLGASDQAKDGNYLYGAFGHDFETADGRRVMVVALTARQWHALVEATESRAGMQALRDATGFDLDSESGRFLARDFLVAVLRPWFAAHTLDAIRKRFASYGVSWGPYQTFSQLVNEDPRCSSANPMFEPVEHPGVGSYLMPRSPLDFLGHEPLPVTRAPRLGEHTEPILADWLKLTEREIGALSAAGTVSLGPT